MKRILSIILTLFILSGTVFAQSESDEYDDGFVYEQNGAGDQFIKIKLGAIFPLNFDGQLNPGGQIELGYYRFLNNWLAVGGEFLASYEVSIGNKILVLLPFSAGVMFQPTYNDFEFSIYVNLGLGYETWQSMDYFPSFVFKTSAGAYYRLNEICSFGLDTSWMLLHEGSNKSFTANFLTLSIGARYHF